MRLNLAAWLPPYKMGFVERTQLNLRIHHTCKVVGVPILTTLIVDRQGKLSDSLNRQAVIRFSHGQRECGSKIGDAEELLQFLLG